MIEFDEAFPEMKTADCSRWDGVRLSYDAIAAKLGEEVLIYESGGDYQGSTYALIRTGTKFGYLEFGWGSCSGCDAAEAAESYADWKALFESLRDGVRWFDSFQGFLSWANERDWKGEWSWHDGVRKFLAAVNEQFGTEIEVD